MTAEQNNSDLTTRHLTERLKKLNMVQSDITGALTVDDILDTLSSSGFDYVKSHIVF